jgi:hypothetical protein
MWEEYPIARKSVKVPAEALEWSLASEEVVNPVCPMMNIQLDRRSQELVDLSTMSHGSTAIPDQGMNVSIGDPEVRAPVVGTGETLSVYAFGGSPPVFDLGQGRTGRGFGPATDEKVEERQQAGQSRGVRGLRRRWIMGCSAFALEWGRP